MRRINWLAAALFILLLAGCSLARPEAGTAVSDPFIGFYVVREDPDRRDSFWSSENPALSEYGSRRFDTKELGPVKIPQLVLFAEKHGTEYVFPGLEGGYSLFVVRETMDNGNASNTVVSNMSPGDGWHTTVTDQGTSDVISGVIYYGPPLGAEDWDPYSLQDIWTVYRVYQTAAGRPYLDGTGNSFSGGGIGAYTETAASRTTLDGEVAEDSVTATVSTEPVARLERLVVTEFDAGNAVVRSGELSTEDLPEIDCAGETAWVLVEEYSADAVVRTLYDRPGPEEECVTHQVVLLDDAGLGYLAWLRINH